MPPAGRTPKCPGKPIRTMDERLCVVLHLGGGCILHNTLVDTGAARTVMGHDKWTDYCSRNGIPNYLCPCARLRTLTGEELPTLGGGQVTIESVFIDVIVCLKSIYSGFGYTRKKKKKRLPFFKVNLRRRLIS